MFKINRFFSLGERQPQVFRMRCKCPRDPVTKVRTCAWFTRKLSGLVTQAEFDSLACVDPAITTTTFAPTTVAPTTAAQTNAVPTTAPPTTAALTSAAPTTAAPTTAAPTTAAQTTAAPTTAAPTTAAQTTAAPTTAAPTTAAPTTAAPIGKFFYYGPEFQSLIWISNLIFKKKIFIVPRRSSRTRWETTMFQRVEPTFNFSNFL
jgi:hypothetical protein